MPVVNPKFIQSEDVGPRLAIAMGVPLEYLKKISVTVESEAQNVVLIHCTFTRLMEADDSIVELIESLEQEPIDDVL